MISRVTAQLFCLLALFGCISLLLNLAGCSKPEPSKADSPARLIQLLSDATEQGNTKQFESLLTGSDAAQQVMRTIFDCALATRDLKSALKSRFGSDSLDAGDVELEEGLPGSGDMSWASNPRFQGKADTGRVSIRTNLFPHDLILHKQENNWLIDADETLLAASAATPEKALSIYQESYDNLLAAIKSATSKTDQPDAAHDQIIGELGDVVAKADMARFKLLRDSRLNEDE